MNYPEASSSTAMTPYEAQAQFAALWSIVRRHPGIVLGSLLTVLVLGLLYYFKAPRTYESKAQVQVITKKFSVNRDDKDRAPTKEQTIETHKVVISSPSLVGRAVRDFALDQLDSLRDAENPVQLIMDNLDASVKEENTTVVQLAYRAPNDADTQKVLQAIVDTYAVHLREGNHVIGKELLDLVTKGKDDLLHQLSENEKAHAEFQRNAPIMWRDGQGVNIHHERQLQIENARKDLLVERSTIDAKLHALETAVASGETSRDAVYYEALKELRLDENYSEWRTAQIAEQQQFAERTALREYASLLMGEYVRLWVEESEKLDSYGQGHPDVESITKRKVRVQEMLSTMHLDQDELANELLGIRRSDDPSEKKDFVAIYLQMLRDRLTVIDQQLDSLDAQFTAEQRKANAMQDYIMTDRRFLNDLDRTKQLFNVVVDRLREINILRDADGDSMYVLQEPEVGEQVAPVLLIVLLGSIMLGTLLGCGLAFAVDNAEGNFRSWPEIRNALDLPVIGGIPVMNSDHRSDVPEFASLPSVLCTVHDDGSQHAEAYRGVRTNLYYSTAAQNYKVIQVTSPLPGDGKSTLTANLAVSIAKSGKRVLILDADFRRPTMSHLLGLSGDLKDRPGLGSVLTGQARLEDALTQTVVDNLFVIPARERPRHPSELLTTESFAEFLAEVRKLYDFVLVDTPPLLPVTDPSIVAAQADGVLLTVRARRGSRVAAQRAVERLRAVDANILGVVVNGWETKGFTANRAYDYGYGYGYGEVSDAVAGAQANRINVFKSNGSNGRHTVTTADGKGRT